MALYIKCMEIPKNCNECRIKRELMYVNPTLCPVNASAHLLVANGMDAKQRREGCPLVEVQEPHGRLIDEDRVIDAIYERVKELQEGHVFREKHGDIDLIGVKPYISKIPTVIEAEGE